MSKRPLHPKLIIQSSESSLPSCLCSSVPLIAIDIHHIHYSATYLLTYYSSNLIHSPSFCLLVHPFALQLASYQDFFIGKNVQGETKIMVQYYVEICFIGLYHYRVEE